MPLRFICPHCHSPLAPETMDAASTPNARLCICPDCDEPIVLAVAALPALAAARVSTPPAENSAR